MRNFLSISRLSEKLLSSVKRFPVTILLTAAWTALLITRGETLFSVAHSRLGLFLAIGTLISLAVALWLEDAVDYIWQIAITVAVTLLWGVYCLYLPDVSGVGESRIWGWARFSVAKIIELVVIGISAFLSIFFISFLARGKEGAFWNFSVQAALHLALALFFGMVIYGGLCLAAYAIESLLGVSGFLSNAYRYLATLSYNLFAAMYWIANIPDKAAKRCEEVSLNKYLKLFALYILTPIAAIYALILYAYLFKILFAWELPKGMVSYMVSTLAVSGLLIITLLYPARVEGKSKFIVFLTRYFGLMMLPLLTLMAIGIFRRLDDYGITILRGYILLINLWFYGIYIYLVLTRAERVKWIPISFTAIALLASFGYWSVSNVTRHVLVTELHKRLDNQKIPPNNSAAFEELYGVVGSEGWEKISSKILYLEERYGKESIQPFFSDDVETTYTSMSSFRRFLRSTPSPGLDGKDEDIDYINFRRHRRTEVYYLNGFNTFVSVDCNPWEGRRDKKSSGCALEGWRLTIYAPSGERPFTLSLREVMTQHKDGSIVWEPKHQVFQYDDYAVIVSFLKGRYYPKADSISVVNFEGYLFYNE